MYHNDMKVFLSLKIQEYSTCFFWKRTNLSFSHVACC